MGGREPATTTSRPSLADAPRLAGAGRELSAGAGDYAELPPVRKIARQFLDGLAAHLSEDGIGSICEVADGDAPHTPGGCPWQAWSVAEPLRAICEDVYKLPAASVQPAAKRDRKVTGSAETEPLPVTRRRKRQRASP